MPSTNRDEVRRIVKEELAVFRRLLQGPAAPVLDHGLLDPLSLLDDDHPQYSLVDGTRPFTGTVAGIDPLADADFTTKLYVDNSVSAGSSLLTAEYRFSTSTTIADPTSGRARINNADPTLATKMAISQTTDTGADFGAVLNALESGDLIGLQDQTDSTKFYKYSITAVVDQGAWFEIDVTDIGSIGLIANNKKIFAILAFISEGTFIGHPDTPAAYSGQDGSLLIESSTNDSLLFIGQGLFFETGIGLDQILHLGKTAGDDSILQLYSNNGVNTGGLRFDGTILSLEPALGSLVASFDTDLIAFQFATETYLTLDGNSPQHAAIFNATDDDQDLVIHDDSGNLINYTASNHIWTHNIRSGVVGAFVIAGTESTKPSGTGYFEMNLTHDWSGTGLTGNLNLIDFTDSRTVSGGTDILRFFRFNLARDGTYSGIESIAGFSLKIDDDGTYTVDGTLVNVMMEGDAKAVFNEAGAIAYTLKGTEFTSENYPSNTGAGTLTAHTMGFDFSTAHSIQFPSVNVGPDVHNIYGFRYVPTGTNQDGIRTTYGFFYDPTWTDTGGTNNHFVLWATRDNIVMAADASGIVFGAGQDARIDWDGTDLILDPTTGGGVTKSLDRFLALKTASGGTFQGLKVRNNTVTGSSIAELYLSITTSDQNAFGVTMLAERISGSDYDYKLQSRMNNSELDLIHFDSLAQTLKFNPGGQDVNTHLFDATGTVYFNADAGSSSVFIGKATGEAGMHATTSLQDSGWSTTGGHTVNRASLTANTLAKTIEVQQTIVDALVAKGILAP